MLCPLILRRVCQLQMYLSVEEHLGVLSMSDKGLVETFARQNTDRAFIIDVL